MLPVRVPAALTAAGLSASGCSESGGHDVAADNPGYVLAAIEAFLAAH